MSKPGEERYDEEGNNKTWEDDDVTEYWLKHYSSTGTCDLCDNTGVIYPRYHTQTKGYFCFCPNGQAMRWHLKTVPERK